MHLLSDTLHAQPHNALKVGRQAEMRSHNRMREAQGLRPLPSKRKTRIPDPSIRIQGFGEDPEGDMGASPQSTYLESSRVTTLDRVLAQLTIRRPRFRQLERRLGRLGGRGRRRDERLAAIAALDISL